MTDPQVTPPTEPRTEDVACPVPACTYRTGAHTPEISAALLLGHITVHQSAASQAAPQRRPPKVDRPRLTDSLEEVGWNAFLQDWETFVRANGISAADQAIQLFSCCDGTLKGKITSICPDVHTKTKDQLLTMMKDLAVIPIAASVRVNELLQMYQHSGESIRTFHSRVKGKALTCRFKVECSHVHDPVGPVQVDYTEKMIRHVLLNGLHDADIQREVFSLSDLDNLSNNDIIARVEAKETAREATSAQSNNAVTLYKKRQREATRVTNTGNKNDNSLPKPQKESIEGECATCKTKIRLYKKMRSGKLNREPFTHCNECWRKTHPPPLKSDSSDANAISFSISIVEEVQEEQEVPDAAPEPLPYFPLRGLSHMTPTVQNDPRVFESGSWITIPDLQCDLNHRIIRRPPSGEWVPESETGEADVSTVNTLSETFLSHHVLEDGRWVRKTAPSHPAIALFGGTLNHDYNHFGFENPGITNIPINAIVDSGAQCCVWSWRDCKAAGFVRTDLIPVRQKLNAVSKNNIRIYGAIILRLSDKPGEVNDGQHGAIIYISPDVTGFYLSNESIKQLGIVSPDFPSIGQTTNTNNVDVHSLQASREENCTCGLREMPPGPPTELPFDPQPENILLMKQWLLKRYANSTFNKCPHQPIPEMKGPPLNIHVDPNATPVSCRVPSLVPLHYLDRAEALLKREESMGVITKVPDNVKTPWCHRLVWREKPNGELRKTVDLSPLNKHTVREVHAMRSPFQLAKGVPANTWRTVTDAWNGYHSIPLREEDRHLTTFLTHIGRYWSNRAVQGFASSGDAFNRRMDEILKDFPRHKRCVDDNLTYDIDLEEHWWRVIAFLELMGKNGLILNPEKFQFCQREVTFAGFHIEETRIQPLPKYFDAIMNYPTPKSTSDIRGWFGLVNQVAHYAQLRDLLAPFRHFLSEKVKFTWNDQLHQSFEKSKLMIIDAIKKGVEIFDPTKKTCLRCDWSKKGIGFYLSQKHCKCESTSPECCENGWRITVCGSRFLQKHEERYAPIEGEALAVAWALDQTKFFTLGCNDLMIVVDHKPLVKIFGDRFLDEIDNTRLFRLKQKTLRWKFDIHWRPGKSNHFSDAVSRHPSDEHRPEDTNTDTNGFISLINSILEDEEVSEIAVLQCKANLNNVIAITWEKVQEATFDEYNDLLVFLQGSNVGNIDAFHNHTELRAYQKKLHVIDDIIMYEDRILIPPSLRAATLETLHSAHQGESGMSLLAQSTVFWPGISKDIEKTRKTCHPCIQNAPSQPKSTPFTPIVPTTPFEAIVADYFDLKENHYLVIADRLSAWTEVYHTPNGSHKSGSRGLITLLKNFFGTFGVPTELSSDQGREFIADDTQDFFLRWGIKHRDSAAYHPQSNGRAELAVKATKRLLENNIGEDGKLDTDKFLRAILTKRNTPDPITKMSPAQIIFGRNLRDALPRINKQINIFNNTNLNTAWTDAWRQKEEALRTRYQGCQQRLAEHSRDLPPLSPGNRVAVQNQTGRRANKWEKTGTVVEVRDHNKYIIKVDGSGRLSLRNRRFLRKLFEDKSMFEKVPQSTPPVTLQPNQAHCSDKAASPFLPQVQPEDAVLQQGQTEQQSDTLGSHTDNIIIPTDNVSRTTEATTPEETLPTQITWNPDRPVRNRQARTVYDASSGQYVRPTE